MIQKCKENIPILLCILALFALALIYYSLSSGNMKENTTDLPMVHITTTIGEMPSCTDIAAPEGCWGASTTDKIYETCSITIDYGVEKFTIAGKIKVRGNTSSYNNNKRSYKIKLDKRLDLMGGEPLAKTGCC